MAARLRQVGCGRTRGRCPGHPAGVGLSVSQSFSAPLRGSVRSSAGSPSSPTRSLPHHGAERAPSRSPPSTGPQFRDHRGGSVPSSCPRLPPPPTHTRISTLDGFLWLLWVSRPLLPGPGRECAGSPTRNTGLKQDRSLRGGGVDAGQAGRVRRLVSKRPRHGREGVSGSAPSGLRCLRSKALQGQVSGASKGAAGRPPARTQASRLGLGGCPVEGEGPRGWSGLSEVVVCEDLGPPIAVRGTFCGALRPGAPCLSPAAGTKARSQETGSTVEALPRKAGA